MRMMIGRYACAALIAGSAFSIAAVALPRVETIASSQPAGAREAESFKIDSGHSSVVFKVKHIGVSWVYGRFNEVSGDIVWNPDDPTKHQIKAEVKATSVDTNSGGRDNHLRGPDFFDVANFPTISFVSTGVKKAGDNTFEVAGDLTMHGVTKSITVTIEKVGLDTLPRFGRRLGVACEFTIKRSDFGMNYGVDGPVGDEVTIMLGLEGAKES